MNTTTVILVSTNTFWLILFVALMIRNGNLVRENIWLCKVYNAMTNVYRAENNYTLRLMTYTFGIQEKIRKLNPGESIDSMPRAGTEMDEAIYDLRKCTNEDMT